MIASGGVVFWILVLLAMTSVIIYFERWIDLHRARINYEDFLKGVINVLDAGNDDEALSICEDTLSPVANVVATAIRHRSGSARVLRDAVDSQGRAEIGRMDRRLASLAIIAQIAPLLGLLGSVIGLVHTIMTVSAREVVSRVDLFGGVMEALIAAAAGLVVMIVVTVMYGSLRVRLDRMVVDLEAAASQIVGYLSTKREMEREAVGK